MPTFCEPVGDVYTTPTIDNLTLSDAHSTCHDLIEVRGRTVCLKKQFTRSHGNDHSLSIKLRQYLKHSDFEAPKTELDILFM